MLLPPLAGIAATQILCRSNLFPRRRAAKPATAGYVANCVDLRRLILVYISPGLSVYIFNGKYAGT